MSDLMAPGADGTDVLLNHPTQLVPMADGTLMLVAWHNHKLRSYDPETGTVIVTCGGPARLRAATAGRCAWRGSTSRAADRRDEDGTLYIVDQRNQIDPQASTPDGIVSTVAGTPAMPGFEGDGGAGDAAASSAGPPAATRRPAAGSRSTRRQALRRPTRSTTASARSTSTSGTIETIAGTGEAGFSGDGGAATDGAAQLPARARRSAPTAGSTSPTATTTASARSTSRAAMIDTVAGTGEQGYAGDGGSATDADARPAGRRDVRRRRRHVRARHVQPRIRRVVLGGER